MGVGACVQMAFYKAGVSFVHLPLKKRLFFSRSCDPTTMFTTLGEFQGDVVLSDCQTSGLFMCLRAELFMSFPQNIIFSFFPIMPFLSIDILCLFHNSVIGHVSGDVCHLLESQAFTPFILVGLIMLVHLKLHQITAAYMPQHASHRDWLLGIWQCWPERQKF